MEYLSVEEAIETPGLRLVLTAGVPGPWGEAAKSMLSYKDLEYIPVRQDGGGANDALMAWTGQNSAPVLVPEQGPAISHWLDLLLHLDLMAPDKPLLPKDQELRATVIGLSTLLAGVDGLAWNRRLQMLAPGMRMDPPPEPLARLGQKYGWSEQALNAAPARMAAITAVFDARLQQQTESPYLVGESVTAVDFYCANFVGMIKPLPAADNPMPGPFRQLYESGDEATLACVGPALLAHRDMMYQRHIALPLNF